MPSTPESTCIPPCQLGTTAWAARTVRSHLTTTLGRVRGREVRATLQGKCKYVNASNVDISTGRRREDTGREDKSRQLIVAERAVKRRSHAHDWLCASAGLEGLDPHWETGVTCQKPGVVVAGTT